MKKKYIHYCWFGGKPLPKLAKKCIKSWQKYLPDFEIIRWDESNTNLDECPFIREAYDAKKWAFVADFVRSKAMNEYGGIYFDTDMEIIKPIDDLLKDKAFIGVEDSGYIACGAWWEKEKNSGLSNYLLNTYKKLKHFDVNKAFDISIPKLITEYYLQYGFNNGVVETQRLEDGTVVYQRDYFYPYSYDRQDNIFTDNTCMIHYYDASWVPKGEKKTQTLIKKHGYDKALKIRIRKEKIKRIIKKTAKLFTYPVYKCYQAKKTKKFFDDRREEFINNINNTSSMDYVVFHNKDWLGTTYATKENFESTCALTELYKNDNISFYAKTICEKKFKLVVFSAFAMGWEELAKEIRKIDKKICIKVLWHGSNAMHGEDYDWEVFKNTFKLLNTKIIDSIGFVKKSMYEYYKELGYNVEFVMNNVNISEEDKAKANSNKDKRFVKIGLYGSGNRWVKNFYNQFAGAALVKNSIIDCIPVNARIKDFSKILRARVVGKTTNVKREELLIRMSQNDINLYCTFVECAPIIPLESFEMGVPCLTGDNHHYWEGTELEKYIVVDKIDNSIEIKNRIELCLKNKDKIMELYKKWKKDYDKQYIKNIKQFLNIR